MAVFLSHSSQDQDFVRRLAADLGRAGITAWIDQDELRAGHDLAVIDATIGTSEALVVVVSPDAAASRWVRREIASARSSNVRVLPVLLRDAPPNWAAGVDDLAFADFRRPTRYRRGLHNLVAAIRNAPEGGRPMGAKEAAALVKEEFSPIGNLFGISHQGVASLYHLANARDWEFADAMDGTSRYWIVEFFDQYTSRIQSYAVIDRKIHELPELFLYDADPQPLPGSVLTFSCALNHLDRMPEERARELLEQHSDATTTISRRYCRFRPVPFVNGFVDSTVAVSAALRSVYGASGAPDHSADLFALVKLERDKRYGGQPLWKVALFDPTVTVSTATVGIDAESGEVLHPRMRDEVLNANFMTMRASEREGGFTLSVANQQRAMESRIWDIPEAGLTATQAIVLAGEKLQQTDPGRKWQVAFLSNTGVVSTALSPDNTSADLGLMNHHGVAGQWVFEVCGTESAPVPDGTRYEYRQIVCGRGSRTELTDVGPALSMTVPLERTPVPAIAELLDGLERARTLAVETAAVDFTVMSVAMTRTPPAAAWLFRFYDDEDIIAKVTVSIDGEHVLQPAAGSHDGR